MHKGSLLYLLVLMRLTLSSLLASSIVFGQGQQDGPVPGEASAPDPIDASRTSTSERLSGPDWFDQGVDAPLAITAVFTSFNEAPFPESSTVSRIFDFQRY